MSAGTGISEIWNSPTLARLYDACELGFAVLDSKGVILAHNHVLHRMLGYQAAELDGVNVLQITHPDDYAITLKKIAGRPGDPSAATYEKRYLTKEGAILWARIRSISIPQDNTAAMQLLIMVEDITEEKANDAELERMAAMVEQSTDAIFQTDLLGNITFWNAGADKLLGYSSEEMIGTPVLKLVPDDAVAKMLDARIRLLRGEVVTDSFGVVSHKDGSRIPVSAILFPLVNEVGAVEAIVGILRDLSELHQVQERLRHSQRMETAGLLAGGIAHDFNNALTVIQGACASLAREVAQDPQQDTYVNLIGRASEKASHLVRQLMAFSRKQEISPRLISLNHQLLELQTLLQQALGNAVVLNLDLRGSANVILDPVQFEQIIFNLCLNARLAMMQGGKLKLSLSEVSYPETAAAPPAGLISQQVLKIPPGTYAKVIVEDEGVGMDAALMSRIFEPFFTTRAKGEGTGLGLSVVYGVISQVGGGLRVESAPGHGCRFSIYLPLVNASLEMPANDSVGNTAVGRGRILILEDDPDVRALMVETLALSGFEITAASNPAEITESIRNTDFDLVITDVVMPKMSGPEFIKSWLLQYPASRVLFMSGYHNAERIPRELSRFTFLQKPFKSDELRRAVEQELNPGSRGFGK